MSFSRCITGAGLILLDEINCCHVLSSCCNRLFKPTILAFSFTMFLLPLLASHSGMTNFHLVIERLIIVLCSLTERERERDLSIPTHITFHQFLINNRKLICQQFDKITFPDLFPQFRKPFL